MSILGPNGFMRNLDCCRFTEKECTGSAIFNRNQNPFPAVHGTYPESNITGIYDQLYKSIDSMNLCSSTILSSYSEVFSWLWGQNPAQVSNDKMSMGDFLANLKSDDVYSMFYRRRTSPGPQEKCQEKSATTWRTSIPYCKLNIVFFIFAL